MAGRYRNEALVGLLALLALAAVVFGGMWLSGRNPLGQQPRIVTAAFDNIGTLAIGNPVKYRGVPVGRVTAIRFSRTNRVLVDLELQPDVGYPPNSVAVIEAASLFGDQQVSLVPRTRIGPGIDSITVPGTPGVLPGARASDITQLTGVASEIAEDLAVLSERVEIAFTEETAIQTREAIENFRDVSNQLEGFINQQTRQLGPAGGNVAAATENIRIASGNVRGLSDTLATSFRTGELRAIVSNAREASGNVNRLVLQLQETANALPGVVGGANRTVASFTQTVASVNRLVAGLEPAVAEVQPTIVRARAGVDALSSILQSASQGEGTLGRLVADPALYEEIQRTLRSINGLLEDVQRRPEVYLRGIKVEVF